VLGYEKAEVSSPSNPTIGKDDQNLKSSLTVVAS